MPTIVKKFFHTAIDTLRHYAALYRQKTNQRLFKSYILTNGSCPTPPSLVLLNVTARCNYKCKMCDVGQQVKESFYYRNFIETNGPKNAPLSMLKRLIDEAATFRPKPGIAPCFVEPLLYPEIVELCHYITNKGLACLVTTNGFYLKDLGRELVDAGISEICISLDGPPAVHNEIRGVKGAFEKGVEGIEEVCRAKNLLRKKHPIIRVSFTISNINYKHLVEFVEAIKGYPIDEIIFSHLNFISPEVAASHNRLFGNFCTATPHNISGGIDPKAVEAETLYGQIKQIKQLRQQRLIANKLTFTPDFISSEAVKNFYNKPEEFVAGNYCLSPWQHITIKPDGTAIPSSAGRCFEYNLGNVFETSLLEVWNGDRYVAFRKKLIESGGAFPACSRCCNIFNKF